MKKEDFGGLFNSQNGKVNIILFFAIVLIFILSVFYSEAMTVRLFTPANFSYNASRNVNFTFEANWSAIGVAAQSPETENVSNCTLWVNSTDTQLSWNILRNVSNDTTQTGFGDTKLQNASQGRSYLNFTFSNDGNYTFSIGCYNNTNSSQQAFLTFPDHNFTVFVDTIQPAVFFENFTNTTSQPKNTSKLYNISIPGIKRISFQINETGSGINLSKNNTVNVSIYLSNSIVLHYNYVNQSDVTNLTCGPVAPGTGLISSLFTCNTSFNFNSNGTYSINVSAIDRLSQSAVNGTTLTLDNIPPVINYFNITNTSRFHAQGGDTGNGIQLGNTSPLGTPSAGAGTARQGMTIFAFANFTDNLTQTLQGALQFYNETNGTWQTPNNSTISNTTSVNTYIAGQNENWINLSLQLPTGRSETFEGRNVSFRIIANDTLGYVNNSIRAGPNMTIQVNDTYAPTVIINGTISVNGSNISDTRPIISWVLNENNELDSINVSVDNTLRSGTGLDGCKKSAFYDTSIGDDNVESHRNFSFQISSSTGCPLTNGTHNVTLYVKDTWGNRGVLFQTFNVQSGTVPGLAFRNVSYANVLSPRYAAVNNTNITSQAGLAFTGSGIANVHVANITYTSSCNSTVGISTNNTVIKPFGCGTGASANRTLTVTVTDTAGNSNTTIFSFLVDDVGPSLSVNAPTNGFNGANNITINLSAKDSDQIVAGFGYFLDTNMLDGTFTNLNITPGILNSTGVNVTNIFNLSFTPGTHKIKFLANDTLGNAVNSSELIFTTRGVVNFSLFGFVFDTSRNFTNTTLGIYNNGNISIVAVNLSNSTGATINDSDVTDQTLKLFIALNSSDAKIINTTIVFNASAANWDKLNFTIAANATTTPATLNKTLAHIQNNYTSTIQELVWLNESIQEFISNNNSYYGVVKYPINATLYEVGSKFEIWYFKDIRDVASTSAQRTNVTECAAGFTVTQQLALSANSFPCWNNTNNESINVYVPHFSAVAFVNNSGKPWVNVTAPATNITGNKNLGIVGNYSISMFVPNISVSLDTISCVYSINNSVANYSMTYSNGICLGATERFKNLGAVPTYNITFTVTDEEGNVNQYYWNFTISDTTAPNNGLITSSPSTTTASVTITSTNESVNATVKYGTVNSTLDSVAMETDFNQTQTVSLSGLTASTTYYYNVTVCDYNGNCKANASVFSFTTSAAATTTTTTTTTTGGGGGAAPSSNIEASAGRQWDTLAAGSSGVLTINNEKIAVTGVIVDVKNAVSNPSITVDSLTSNPLSSSAAAKVYQYLQITKSNIADADTSKITIKFKVPKSWLTTNAVAESDVILWRYTSGTWSQLDTKLVSSDANNVYYEAVTSGLSTFAIGSREGGTSAFAIIDMIRDFYAGTSSLTAFDIIDQIRSFYGG